MQLKYNLSEEFGTIMNIRVRINKISCKSTSNWVFKLFFFLFLLAIWCWPDCCYFWKNRILPMAFEVFCFRLSNRNHTFAAWVCGPSLLLKIRQIILENIRYIKSAGSLIPKETYCLILKETSVNCGLFTNNPNPTAWQASRAFFLPHQMFWSVSCLSGRDFPN